mmetsp:Transcript_2608/g.7144  ORF Transcript_2608/g.7144 Transcript_2608/m.7144 type:complete len:283 (-) Transcript_2608:214-1062(-)
MRARPHRRLWVWQQLRLPSHQHHQHQHRQYQYHPHQHSHRDDPSNPQRPTQPRKTLPPGGTHPSRSAPASTRSSSSRRHRSRPALPHSRAEPSCAHSAETGTPSAQRRCPDAASAPARTPPRAAATRTTRLPPTPCPAPSRRRFRPGSAARTSHGTDRISTTWNRAESPPTRCPPCRHATDAAALDRRCCTDSACRRMPQAPAPPDPHGSSSPSRSAPACKCRKAPGSPDSSIWCPPTRSESARRQSRPRLPQPRAAPSRNLPPCPMLPPAARSTVRPSAVP